ncbi:MAG: DUF115 domain-containing protein [Termitinemataceae bacterium]|nr:MAG: DUF115 domain-containing protein [Termitinemataceae bacterium]
MVSDSIFDKNISVMRCIVPHLADKLSQMELSESAKKIEVSPAASGDPTLIVNGNYVHSGREPAKEGKRIAQSALSGGGENTAVVVLGMGLGYSLEEAVKLCPKCTFVIVEHDIDIFKAALSVRDFSKVFCLGSFIFVIGGRAANIFTALNELKTSTLTVLKNIAITNLDKEWFAELEGNINTFKTKTDVNNATLKRFGRRFERNIKKNTPLIKKLPGVCALFGKFKMPVLLLAAGPSLDEIAPYIKDLQKRFLLVASDTALRFLKNNGAAADFVFTVDPQFWNSRHLTHALPKESILIAECSVYPSVMRQAGAVFATESPFYSGPNAFMREKGILAAGGSVITSAWDFARLIGGHSEGGQAEGERSIYIAGLDLSFPDLKTHYKGALFEELAASCASRLASPDHKSFLALRGGVPFFARSAGGAVSAPDEKVLTDKRMSLYAAWFENKFDEFPQIKNYNFSNKGLFIKGMGAIEASFALKMPICRGKIDTVKRNLTFFSI